MNITQIKGFLPKQKNVLEKSMQVVANTEEGAVINLLYSWEVDTIAKGLRVSRIYGREGSITFETNGFDLDTTDPNFNGSMHIRSNWTPPNPQH